MAHVRFGSGTRRACMLGPFSAAVVSNEEPSVMSLCEVHWKSEVLRKQVGTYVILPDVGRPPFPTFYLLHGLSDDHTAWLRRTRIEWYVRELPLIVVMPD